MTDVQLFACTGAILGLAAVRLPAAVLAIVTVSLIRGCLAAYEGNASSGLSSLVLVCVMAQVGYVFGIGGRALARSLISRVRTNSSLKPLGMPPRSHEPLG
jgi:hypothetical protein